MAIPNQGYRQDLNLEETPNDTTALNNIGGAGISNDLQIIQNNLRNISTVGYTSVTDGFFIDTTADYTYTNDDVITALTLAMAGNIFPHIAFASIAKIIIK